MSAAPEVSPFAMEVVSAPNSAGTASRSAGRSCYKGVSHLLRTGKARNAPFGGAPQT
jgi:hypothetical protein